MGLFHGREYAYSEAGITDILVEIARERGSCAAIDVALVEMPEDAVDLHYHWPQILRVRLPIVEKPTDRTWWLMHYFISAWPLFLAVRMRFEDAEGNCRLWLDDLPRGEGLAYSSNAIGNVLIPDANFLDTKSYLHLRQQIMHETPPWRDRTDLVFWRGNSTGNRHSLRVSHWKDLPRFRLAQLARDWNRDDLFDIGLSGIAQIWDEDELFEIEQAGLMRPAVSQLAFGHYRHTIDIDGNSNSWPGLFTKLLLGNTVLKVDSPIGLRQWYYDKLIPWKNFVPVSDAMTDLIEVATWLQAKPDEAEAIAQAGRDLAWSMTFEATLESEAPRIRAILRR
jgi:hypothetical protein